jgi:diaminohydroxyphosphoribosylaminopyrimidine deaminase/5-amino-6-(5-phosphoribosylamino)uracil reductase
MRDDEAMAQALQVSAAARRRSAPNPWVGCVLVRAGKIVGEGASLAAGGAHAEAVALERAGETARGATAYVTLEPCSHHGRTPPCADALITAGVTRVVAALEDPDPKVAGAGLARLREAGIEVVTGVGAEAAQRELAAYLHHRRTGRPLVVAKVAMSIDGRIAAADGTSQWLTSTPARADAHELRADSQAIIVGAGTAIADRPKLTVRDVEQMPVRQPLRVLLDARGRVPATGPLFDTALAPTLVITTADAAPETVDAWRSAGAKVETVAPAATGTGVDLGEVLTLLGRDGVLQVLVEGGSSVTASVYGRYADRFVVYVAPVVLGINGVPVLATVGPKTMIDADMDRYRLVGVRQLGADARLDYELVID